MKIKKSFFAFCCLIIFQNNFCMLNQIKELFQTYVQQKSPQELNKELLHAIDCYKLEEVRNAIAAGASVNAINVSGYTALIRACQGGGYNDSDRTKNNFEIAKLLIECGADVNLRDSYDINCGGGQTPIMWAIQYNRNDLLQLLISNGARLNEVCLSGYTVLMSSVRSMPYLFKFLLNYFIENFGLDYTKKFINLKNKYKFTALMESCYAGDSYAWNHDLELRNKVVENTKLLLKYGAEVNSKNISGQTALIRACGVHKKELVEILLEAGANFTIKDDKEKKGIDHVVKLYRDSNKELEREIVGILKSYEDRFINFKKELFEAIKNNDLNKVRCLATIKPYSFSIYDENGNNPLHIAAINNRPEIFRFILSIRPILLTEVNNQNKTPLEAYPQMIMHLYIRNSINLEIKNN